MTSPTQAEITTALSGLNFRVKPKQISTPGYVPTVADLLDGEIAVDTDQGKIYARSGNNIALLANQSTSTAESLASFKIIQAENGTFNPTTAGGYQWSHGNDENLVHTAFPIAVKLYYLAFHTRNGMSGLELTFEVWNNTNMVGSYTWDVPDYPTPNANGDAWATHTLPVPLDVPADHIIKVRTSAASVGGGGSIAMDFFAEDPPLATVPTSYWGGNPGATYSVDRANGILQAIEITGNIEITDFTNFLNVGDEVVLYVRQDATAGYTLTLPGFANNGENVYMDESLSGGRVVQLSSYSNSRHKVVITKWHNEYDVVVSGATAFTS